MCRFLETEFTDSYPALLKREFKVMKSKFGLLTMPVSYWKKFRMRPSSFPTVRLAQMAMVIHKNDGMFSNIIEKHDIKDVKTMFDIRTNSYWENHYYFEKVSARGCRKIGDTTVDMLIINAVIPVIFAMANIMIWKMSNAGHWIFGRDGKRKQQGDKTVREKRIDY